MARRTGTTPKTTLGSLLESSNDESKPGHTLIELPVDLIDASRYQARSHFDQTELEELATSIRTQGLLQPVTVREIVGSSGSRYELIAGERRLRASILANENTIPALVRETTDLEMSTLGLIENIQRSALNVVEEARALQRLQSEFNLTQAEVAESTGKSRPAIANAIRLLSLDPTVLDLLERGDISAGHARALLGIEDSSEQLAIAKTIVERQLNVRQVEALVAEHKRRLALTNAEPERSQRSDNEVKLESGLSEFLGLDVLCKINSKGKGRVVIQFDDEAELEELLKQLQYKR